MNILTAHISVGQQFRYTGKAYPYKGGAPTNSKYLSNVRLEIIDIEPADKAVGVHEATYLVEDVQSNREYLLTEHDLEKGETTPHVSSTQLAADDDIGEWPSIDKLVKRIEMYIYQIMGIRFYNVIKYGLGGIPKRLGEKLLVYAFLMDIIHENPKMSDELIITALRQARPLLNVARRYYFVALQKVFETMVRNKYKV